MTDTQAKQSPKQASSDAFKLSPKAMNTASTTSGSTLANTFQKAHYQSAYLQSFLVNQEDQPIADQDERFREEMLESLQRKWGYSSNSSAPKAKQGSDLFLSTIDSHGTFGTLRDPYATAQSDHRSNMRVTSIQFSFLAVKWLPTFLPRWNLDSIRVKFSFFTDQNVLSHELRYQNSPVPGTLNPFLNPFTYSYNNNQDHDNRFHEITSKPLYIQITDSSGNIVLAYGIVNLPPLDSDATSSNKIYEVDLFMPDENNFLAGSIHVNCLRVQRELPTDIINKPEHHMKQGKENVIIWDVNPGTSNVTALEIINPYHQSVSVAVSIQDESGQVSRSCRAEIITDLDELDYWERKKRIDRPTGPKLRQDDDGKPLISVGPGDTMTIFVKLKVLSLDVPFNNAQRPQISFRLVVDFKHKDFAQVYSLVPNFLKPIISRNVNAYVPANAPQTQTVIKLQKYQNFIQFESGAREAQPILPLVYLTHSCFSWTPVDYLEAIQLVWTPIYGMDRATCDVVLYADQQHNEILEVIRVTFEKVKSVVHNCTLGHHNQISLPVNLKKGGALKVHYVSSRPEIVDLHGKEKPHTPYLDFNALVTLSSIKERKENINLFCVDSITNEVLQAWIISTVFNFEETKEEEEEKRHWIDICREASVFISGMDLFFNDLTLSLYTNRIPGLQELDSFSTKGLQLIKKLLSGLEQPTLPGSLKNLLASLVSSTATYYAILDSLGSLHNFQHIMVNSIISALFRDTLKDNIGTFQNYLALIFLKSVLECRPRNSKTSSKTSHAINETLFDKTFRQVSSLLEYLESIFQTYSYHKEQAVFGNSEKIIVTVPITTDAEESIYNAQGENPHIAELAASTHIMCRNAIYNIKNLKQESSSLSVQAAAIFELLVSSLAKIYVRTHFKEPVKPLMTFTTYKEGGLESEAAVLVRTKDFVKKANEVIYTWRDESIGRGYVTSNKFALENLSDEIEKKLVEQSEMMYTKFAASMAGQHKGLVRLHTEVQHIKVLSLFCEMFNSPGNQKVMSLPYIVSTKDGSTMHQSYARLSRPIVELAFDDSLYLKFVESTAQKGDEASYDKAVRLMKIVSELGKALSVFGSIYALKITLHEKFLENLKELEVHLGKKDEVCRGLSEVMKEYGEAYEEVFDFMGYYYVKMTDDLGLQAERIEKLRVNVEKLIKFKKTEEGMDDLLTRVKRYKSITDKNEAAKLKAQVQEVISEMKKVEEIATYFFTVEVKEIKLFEGMEEVEEVKENVKSGSFQKLKNYLSDSLNYMK